MHTSGLNGKFISRFCLRLSRAVTFAALLFVGIQFEAAAAQSGIGGKRDIKVMTQNVYIGAEVDSIVTASDPSQIPILVAQTLGAIIQTDFPARSGAIA